MKKIICKKDTADILEKTIMPHLTEDLRTLSSSSVVFRASDDNTSIICELMIHCLTKFCNTEWQVLDKIDIYVMGDTAWLVLVLGMEDMSPHWCEHCLLQQKDWKHHDHQLGEP